MYSRQNRYDEAESLHLETLETRRRVLGESDPDSLRIPSTTSAVSRRFAATVNKHSTGSARPSIAGSPRPTG